MALLHLPTFSTAEGATWGQWPVGSPAGAPWGCSSNSLAIVIASTAHDRDGDDLGRPNHSATGRRAIASWALRRSGRGWGACRRWVHTAGDKQTGIRMEAHESWIISKREFEWVNRAAKVKTGIQNDLWRTGAATLQKITR